MRLWLQRMSNRTSAWAVDGCRIRAPPSVAYRIAWRSVERHVGHDVEHVIGEPAGRDRGAVGGRPGLIAGARRSEEACARLVPEQFGDVETEIGRDRRPETMPADHHRRPADGLGDPVRRLGADLDAVEADEGHAGVDAIEAFLHRRSRRRRGVARDEICIDDPFGEAARPADGGGVAGRVRVVSRKKSVKDRLAELHRLRSARGQRRRRRAGPS